MIESAPFEGFTPAAVDFLKGLKRNNKKAWFEKRRNVYESSILEPSRQLVVDLGRELRKAFPYLVALPKSGGSLFRIHRDVRFSADKSPYKTHVGFWFWDRRFDRKLGPGFYFHFDPSEFYLGAGVYRFDKAALMRYREAVGNDASGERLVRVLKKLKNYPAEGSKFKRVPRGFDPDHPRKALLLHEGLFAGVGAKKIPKEFYSRAFIKYAVGHFKKMAPLNDWLAEALK